jgi:histidine ammonia-lyase
VRKLQNPARNFGAAPTAAWTAFRKIVPFQQDPASRPAQPIGRIAYAFLKDNLASMFYAAGPKMP